MTPAKRRELLLNVGLALVMFLGMCVAAELGLRYVLLRRYNPFQADEALGVRLKSDFDGAYPRVRVRTDRHGRRIPGDQEGDASGRYLFVGDSVTFGFSMLARDSFPSLVGEILGSRADATVAAVPGYNLEQALGLARESVQRARAEFVVYGLVVNDVGSALSPATYEGLNPHAARAREGGFLAQSAFVAFVQRRLNRLSSRFAGPETEQRSANVVRRYPDDLPAGADAAFRTQWLELESFQRQLGVPVFVLVAPFALQVYEEPGDRGLQEYVETLCAGSNLICLDPLEHFLAHSDEPLFTEGSSYHYNRAGHALLARWLAGRLVDQPTDSPAPSH